MNVFISADMEGTCGIADWPETERSTPKDYEPFQRQMTREVCAACKGAVEGGARQIFVRDAHDSARNIDATALPECARLMRGWTGDPLCMMSGLDSGDYDAVLFTGYHAWASCPGNPLSHTMNLRSESVTLNGIRMSEFLMNAYTAGYYHVPVVFLSGDKALCEFAAEFIPGISTVPVNEGRGGAVVSMHPDAAVKAIQTGVKRSLKNIRNCTVPMPDFFEMSVRFKEHTTAYSKSFYPGASLEQEKDVCYSSDDWFEMLRFCHFVLND